MPGTMIFQSAHPLVPVRPREGEPRAVSWNGCSFAPDERGINWLPVEAVNEMIESHGMVGVPGAVACEPAPDPRDAVILQLQARIAELENPAPPKAAEQTTDGGATRQSVFPPEGEHPEGGPQVALEVPAAEVPAPENPPEKPAAKSGRPA
jgi:hypothetical protein